MAGHHIDSHTVGAVQQHFNVGAARTLRFSLPPLAEQDGVLQTLGALDDKIELNRRMNETLEAMARAIFKDWFVDFGPVRAKQEGRAPYLAPDIWSLFPDRLDDEGKPEGWQTSRLEDLCARVAIGPFGSDITTDNFVGHGVPVIRGVNLKDGFIEDGFVYLTEEKADSLSNANAFPGNIVLTHRGTLGQVGIIPSNSNFSRYIISQSQMVLAADPKRATPRFLFEFLRSPLGRDQLLAHTSQTGVPAIARPTTSLKSLRLTDPGLTAIEKFDHMMGPLVERENLNSGESRTLTSLRDLLLPKLMSGEIRVKDAEKLVGQAA
jgi:type I restriction enzyme, S subunit